jgi:hypothetical protein
MIGSGYLLTAGLGELTIAHSLLTNFAKWLKLNERKLIELHKRENAGDRKEIPRRTFLEEIIGCLLCVSRSRNPLAGTPLTP